MTCAAKSLHVITRSQSELCPCPSLYVTNMERWIVDRNMSVSSTPGVGISGWSEQLVHGESFRTHCLCTEQMRCMLSFMVRGRRECYMLLEGSNNRFSSMVWVSDWLIVELTYLNALQLPNYSRTKAIIRSFFQVTCNHTDCGNWSFVSVCVVVLSDASLLFLRDPSCLWGQSCMLSCLCNDSAGSSHCPTLQLYKL